MAEVTLQLPDSLAKDAEAAGLLAPDAMQALLREALRRQAGQAIAATRDAVAQAGIRPVPLDEVEAMVRGIRSGRCA
jgi:hypothetical protein